VGLKAKLLTMGELRDFDVALSFAGEDRAYVDAVAHALRNRGVKVFYDLFEEVDLWGKDLYTHLSEIYQKRARFTVMFISEAYGRKLWTNHERQAAQARAFQEAEEYILPVRFDETEIPGVLPTVGYISLRNCGADKLASLIEKKLGRPASIVSTKPTRDVASVTPPDSGSSLRGRAPAAIESNGTAINDRLVRTIAKLIALSAPIALLGGLGLRQLRSPAPVYQQGTIEAPQGASVQKATTPERSAPDPSACQRATNNWANAVANGKPDEIDKARLEALQLGSVCPNISHLISKSPEHTPLKSPSHRPVRYTPISTEEDPQPYSRVKVEQTAEPSTQTVNKSPESVTCLLDGGITYIANSKSECRLRDGHIIDGAEP